MRTVFFLFAALALASCEPKGFKVPGPAMEPAIKMNSSVAISNKEISGNAIVAFKGSAGNDNTYLFRLVGLPGDSIKIVEGKLYVNGKTPAKPTALQYQFFVKTALSLPERILSERGIWDYRPASGGYRMHISEENAEYLRKLEGIKEVKKLLAAPSHKDPYLYEDFRGWNRDYFGPLYLPAKGDKIRGKALKRYALTILEHELVNVEGMQEYTFKKNYGFVMGDNRHNALDSRYLGLIPIENLLGTVEKVSY